MTESDSEAEQKEQHRLGTINRWDVPDGTWATKYDWTRYRGPSPWPVPSGWVFKDPEGGGWWEYFGEAGVGHPRDDDIFEALKNARRSKTHTRRSKTPARHTARTHTWR